MVVLGSVSACSEEELTGIVCTSPALLFTESEGRIIIESESVPDVRDIGDWQYQRDLPGYKGSGYLYYAGENAFGKPGNSVLSYQIRISNPGTYRFVYSGRIAEGDNNTEANDLWIRFADADDFYGYRDRNNSYVYPRGSGKSPHPKGASKEGWLKAYMNKLDTWLYAAHTSDHNAHLIYVHFDSPGTYSMEVSGRSHGFAIDRFVLFKEEGDFASKNGSKHIEQVFGTSAESSSTCLQ